MELAEKQTTSLQQVIAKKREMYALEIRCSLRKNFISEKRLKRQQQQSIDAQLVGALSEQSLTKTKEALTQSLTQNYKWQDHFTENLQKFVSTEQGAIIESSIVLRRLFEELDIGDLKDYEEWAKQFVTGNGLQRCLFIIDNRKNEQIDELLLFNALIMIASLTLFGGCLWLDVFMVNFFPSALPLLNLTDGINKIRAIIEESNTRIEFLELVLLTLGNVMAERENQYSMVLLNGNQSQQFQISLNKALENCFVDADNKVIFFFIFKKNTIGQHATPNKLQLQIVDSVSWLLINIVRRQEESILLLDTSIFIKLQKIYKCLISCSNLAHNEELGAILCKLFSALLAERQNVRGGGGGAEKTLKLEEISQKDLLQYLIFRNPRDSRYKEQYSVLEIVEKQVFFDYIEEYLPCAESIQYLLDSAQQNKDRAIRVLALSILRGLVSKRVEYLFGTFSNFINFVNSLYEQRPEAELKICLQIVLIVANDPEEEFFAALLSHGLIKALQDVFQRREQYPEAVFLCLMILQRILEIGLEQHGCLQNAQSQRVQESGLKAAVEEFANCTRKQHEQAVSKAQLILDTYFNQQQSYLL